MLLAFSDQLQSLLGHGDEIWETGIIQTALRGVVVYSITLVLVRLASKRFMAKASAFDVVVGIMLGSIMSRGILGLSPIVLTLTASCVILALHNLFAVIAYRFDWFGPLVKGRNVFLIKDGVPQQREMKKANITEKDLKEAMRRQTGHTDPTQFEEAYLERSGKISFIPYEHEKGKPRVCSVSVEKGVQTVRIEIE